MESKILPLDKLLIDADNPRFDARLEQQTDAIREMVAKQGTKLAVLATDILEHGLNPSEALIVTESADEPGYYVVLEGNRRIAALKILDDPDLISGAVDESLVKRFKKLAADYDSVVEFVQTVVVDDRADARHWIELRHTGEQEGAGIVRWGAAEVARFRHRAGQPAPHLQVLDFLESRGEITAETRRDVPITSLRRLLGNPYVRTKLGIDVRSGEVETRLNDNEISGILKYVVEDLASGNTRTKDIYLKDDRIRYADSLPRELLPTSPDPSAEFRRLGAPATPRKPKASSNSRRSMPSSAQRSTLIPRSCIIRINQARINDVYRELKQLDIEKFSNAVAVLFRVFIELSVDAYVKRETMNIRERTPLDRKVEAVADKLHGEGKLDTQQVKAVRRATQKDHYLALSVDTMHQYIHNRFFLPAPADLRAAWDSLEGFIMQLWA